MSAEMFASIVGADGVQKVQPEPEVFFFSIYSSVFYEPPSKFFTERGNIDDAIWNFQLKPRKTAVSPIYLAKLNNCIVTPQGFVIDCRGKIIVESIYPLSIKQFFEDGHMEVIKNYIDLFNNDRMGSHDVKILDEAVHCRDIGESGYYHWIASVMPRLFFTKKTMQKNDIPILVESETKFSRDWLEFVGDRSDFIGCNGRAFIVKKLYYPSPAQVGHSHYVRNPKLIENFVQETRDLLGNNTDSNDDLIYITRTDAPVRRLLNELELIDRMSSFGFKVLSLSSMSVVEQVKAFQRAKIVVGPHGAGLANIIFANKNTKLVEIFPFTRTWPGFKVLSKFAECEYFCYVSGSVEDNAAGKIPLGNEDFVINTKDFMKFLQACMLRVEEK